MRVRCRRSTPPPHLVCIASVYETRRSLVHTLCLACSRPCVCVPLNVFVYNNVLPEGGVASVKEHGVLRYFRSSNHILRGTRIPHIDALATCSVSSELCLREGMTPHVLHDRR